MSQDEIRTVAHILTLVGFVGLLLRCFLYSQHGREGETFHQFEARIQLTREFRASMQKPEYRARVEAAQREKAAAEGRLVHATEAAREASVRMREALDGLRSARAAPAPASSESGGEGAPPEAVIEARARLQGEVRASADVKARVLRARAALAVAQNSLKDVFLDGLNPRRARAVREAAGSTPGMQGRAAEPMEIQQADDLESGRLLR